MASVARIYNTSLDAIRASDELNTFLHGDYRFYKPEWTMIRDAISGERRVKDRGVEYLPPLDDETGTSYLNYKSRASFVNMTARTLSGMTGTIFRHPVRVDGFKLEAASSVTLDGHSINMFAKQITYEVLGFGRVGVLVESAPDGSRIYLSPYVAENILSWRTKIINGKEVLTYVLLRELINNTPILDGSLMPASQSPPTTPDKSPYSIRGGIRARYRVLMIDEADGIYKQRVYQTDQNGNPILRGMPSKIRSRAPGGKTRVKGPITREQGGLANPTGASDPLNVLSPYEEIIPTKGGKPFDFIPFLVIGPMTPSYEVQRSPIADIAYLNMAHYRVSAQLEHGRFYTALPVYYVQASPGQEQAEYRVGPSVVWECPQGATPGILEYHGTGLSALATSMTEKEEHIAQLGGRIMGLRPSVQSEATEVYQMKALNEMSILLNATDSVSTGLSRIMTWYLDWARVPTTRTPRVLLNQDFKQLQIGGRELRAVALLYQSGLMPIDEVFRVLQDAEYIHEETTLEDFKNMLDDAKQFPNQPDVEAMKGGFKDAGDRTKYKIAELQAHDQPPNDPTANNKAEETLRKEMLTQGRQTRDFETQPSPSAKKGKGKVSRKG